MEETMTKAKKKKPVIVHYADVECGVCGHVTPIGLGGAHAIVCTAKGCDAEIVLGEDGPDLGAYLEDLREIIEEHADARGIEKSDAIFDRLEAGLDSKKAVWKSNK
jgi:hypothetical protein